MHRIETVIVGDGPRSEMEVFIFEPDGHDQHPGPHPGLILAQHIPVGHTGVENDTFTLKAVERFAANGFAVAVPFIFHWWPKEAEMDIKREEFRDN